MDRITSTEFRKRYPRLVVPTAVSANGRVVGYWTPVVPPVQSDLDRAEDIILRARKMQEVVNKLGAGKKP